MYKSKLQELCHEESWNLPEYSASKIGPDHNPRFTATVTVNGIVFATPDQYRSSKEAQNTAAEMAFHHFIIPKPQKKSPNKPLSNASFPSSSGFANSLNFSIKPSTSDILQPTIQEATQSPLVNEAPLEVKNEKKSTGFANSLNFSIKPSTSDILQPTIQEATQSPLVNEAPLEVKNEKKSTGFANSLNFSIKPSTSDILQPTIQEATQSPLVSEAPLEVKNEKKSTVVQHMYKNQLQNYAQKKNLSLPLYSYEREGPPHASRFKSRVTIDGHTYESLEYFPTVREAEHAAAKVACDSLLLNEVQEDESGLYKNALQELAQRKGFQLPNYNTTVSGPPHTPIFVSTVEIGRQLFQGQEAKNKKQAEMNAAKVAYNSLQELRATQGSMSPSPDYDTKEALKSSSSTLQLVTNTGDLPQNVKPKDNVTISKKKDKEDEDRTIQDPTFLSSGYDIKEAMKVVSSSIRQSIISSSGDMPKKAKTKLMICDQEDEDGNQEKLSSKSTTGDAEVNPHHSSILPPEAEITAKRHRCSSSSDIIYASLHDPFPAISSSSEASTSSHSSNSECSSNSITNSTIVPPAGMGKLPGSKVLIYPRRQNMAIPDGATELPFSDDKWLALNMDL